MNQSSRSLVVTNMSMARHESPANYQQQVIITIMITLFGIWSTIGNMITILATTKCKYMRTKTNLFILSLAFSDLVSGVIASPLWLYRRTWGYNPWEWGQVTCKLYWSLDETTSYCTAMHIASFATWRFILVKWPHRRGSTSRRSIVIWIGLIWMLSISFGGIIYSFFFQVMEKPQDGGVYSNWPTCSINIAGNGISNYMTYYMFSSTTFMMIPMSILLGMSLLITKELFFSRTYKSEIRKLKEKKAIAQLGLIAASFMIGYLPMTSYMIWSVRVNNKNKSFDYWMGVAVYFCLRLSECMNPIAYNVSSDKMRKASREVIAYARSCCDKTMLPVAYNSRASRLPS